jgi:hypothetical protein
MKRALQKIDKNKELENNQKKLQKSIDESPLISNRN